jgi:hypothetical protein
MDSAERRGSGAPEGGEMNRSPVFKARLRRLSWWWHLNLGRLGVVAVVLSLVTAALALWVRPALMQAQAVALRNDMEREQAAARLSPAGSVAAQRDPREDWFEALPEDSGRSTIVVRLLTLLHASRVTDDTADYVAEEQEPGLLRVRVTVPVNGRYTEVRELVGRVLDRLPNAALDSIELEQQPDERQALSGQLRLSLFFRRSAR